MSGQMRKQTVTMRWRDVIFGGAQHVSGCPVALAIKRACNTSLVTVSLGGITVDGELWDYPHEIAQYIFKVDQLHDEGAGWLKRLMVLGKLPPFEMEQMTDKDRP